MRIVVHHDDAAQLFHGNSIIDYNIFEHAKTILSHKATDYVLPVLNNSTLTLVFGYTIN